MSTSDGDLRAKEDIPYDYDLPPVIPRHVMSPSHCVNRKTQLDYLEGIMVKVSKPANWVISLV